MRVRHSLKLSPRPSLSPNNLTALNKNDPEHRTNLNIVHLMFVIIESYFCETLCLRELNGTCECFELTER